MGVCMGGKVSDEVRTQRELKDCKWICTRMSGVEIERGRRTKIMQKYVDTSRSLRLLKRTSTLNLALAEQNSSPKEGYACFTYRV